MHLRKNIVPSPPSNSRGTNALLLRAAAKHSLRNNPKTALGLLPSLGFDSYPAPDKPAQGVGMGSHVFDPCHVAWQSPPIHSPCCAPLRECTDEFSHNNSAPDTISIWIDVSRERSAAASETRFFYLSDTQWTCGSKDSPVLVYPNLLRRCRIAALSGDSLIP